MLYYTSFSAAKTFHLVVSSNLLHRSLVWIDRRLARPTRQTRTRLPWPTRQRRT